jgi:hypothetical protein
LRYEGQQIGSLSFTRGSSFAPTPLHRQIKVLHEALARFFFRAFKHKRDRQALQARHRFTCWARWA